MFTKTAIILAAANLAAAHTTFQSFVIDGKDQGQHFAVQTPSNGNNPILDVTSTAMICNGGKATSDQVEVAAGSKLGMQWHHNDPASAGDGDDPIAPSHKGPVMVYIAKADTNGEGAVWTKIYEDGLTGSKWGVDNLISSKGLLEIDLPNLEAGDYLIRPEMIGLHEASAEGKAQFYNGCGQIKVTGSGSAALPATGVDMTKAYKATDPGVMFNIYGGATDYTIPGPAVWDGASSGSSPSTPATSAAPSASAPAATPTKEAEPSTPSATKPASTPSAAPSAAPSATPSTPSTGSGSAALPATGVDMTKAYKATDPGVMFNIYGGATDYTVPGPKVWDAATAGSAPSTPSKPVESAAPSTPASSAAPSATPSPVESAAPSAPSATKPAATPAPSTGSGSALPETFTIEQFIQWLKTATGSSASKARRHARAFNL